MRTDLRIPYAVFPNAFGLRSPSASMRTHGASARTSRYCYALRGASLCATSAPYAISVNHVSGASTDLSYQATEHSPGRLPMCHVRFMRHPRPSCDWRTQLRTGCGGAHHSPPARAPGCVRLLRLRQLRVHGVHGATELCAISLTEWAVPVRIFGAARAAACASLQCCGALARTLSARLPRLSDAILCSCGSRVAYCGSRVR